ncbi:MAG: DNA replication and repair protein RecF, partial [Woeseiaceae bacterium]|nr:DNA replication and repair protein RecF [Woeseiaceae bacterium]
MPIRTFTATDFRCLAEVEFEPDPEFSLIVGPNASGKTSILEGLAYLGRGRSFRRAGTTELVRHGTEEFVLFARVADGDHETRLGARNGRAGLEVRVDGVAGGGAAALAAALPLQVIDPDVHDLVAGAPDERRRYLDWIAFHVEHGYLEAWRRFRRVLRQRNAALRADAAPATLAGWTTEFVAAAERLDTGRRRALQAVLPALEVATDQLLGEAVRFSYEPGWNPDKGLAAVLDENASRERQAGATQYGAHRADLKLTRETRRARAIVSRGQQKLL